MSTVGYCKLSLLARSVRFFAVASAVAGLAACASQPPVAAGYSGPTATITDSSIAESRTKVQMFVVSEIDGKAVANSIGETASANRGRGFLITPTITSRTVPAKELTLTLRATHVSGALIQSLFSAVAGTFFSVQGTVVFSPAPQGRYVVRGELKESGSTVWLEDEVTGQPVTKKIDGK